MKGMTIAICISLVSALPATAQEQPFHLLRGHISTQGQEQWSNTWDVQNQGGVDSPDYLDPGNTQMSASPTEVQTVKESKFKKVRHGLASAAKAVGKFSDAVAIEVLESMLNSSQYSPPPAVSPASAPNGIYHDTCVHGYTPSTCPYGYYGTSYGSPYLSGPGNLRMRPDYVGGYRFYTSRGVSGTMRPDYLGGYQMQVFP